MPFSPREGGDPPRPAGPACHGTRGRGVACLVAVAALVAGPSRAADSVYRRGPASATADPVAPPAEAAPVPSPIQSSPAGAETLADAGQAERIVAAALAGIARAPSISLRVRQLVRVGGRVFKGGGRYVQSGIDEDQRFRFEARLSAESEEFDILEVCDGLFHWNSRRQGYIAPTTERIDVRRLREKLAALGLLQRGDTAAYLGGILEPLAQTREWFRFTSAVAVEIDGVPAWSITGEWDRERLAALLPDEAEAIRVAAAIEPARLPEGLPWSVRFSISRKELFPFRIEWLAVPGPRPAHGPPEVVGLMEFYDVRIGDPVDAAAFVHRPGTEGLIDITDIAVTYLKPLRP
ncbi:MAG: hypothetical protein FJ309_04835 [Planctomycetes bacterium]|nr:hypothetical protein [Planctomycetota bacterium]